MRAFRRKLSFSNGNRIESRMDSFLYDKIGTISRASTRISLNCTYSDSKKCVPGQ